MVDPIWLPPSERRPSLQRIAASPTLKFCRRISGPLESLSGKVHHLPLFQRFCDNDHYRERAEPCVTAPTVIFHPN